MRGGRWLPAAMVGVVVTATACGGAPGDPVAATVAYHGEASFAGGRPSQVAFTDTTTSAGVASCAAAAAAAGNNASGDSFQVPSPPRMSHLHWLLVIEGYTGPGSYNSQSASISGYIVDGSISYDAAAATVVVTVTAGASGSVHVSAPATVAGGVPLTGTVTWSCTG